MRSQKRIMKSLLLVLNLTLGLPLLSAEDFRIHRMNIAELSSPFDKKSVTMGVNDALGIKLPADVTFIDGIEIALKVPEIVLEWRDSVAWSIYSNIRPVPTEGLIDYSGNRVEVGTFEGASLYTVKVPTRIGGTVAADRYSHLTAAVTQSGGETLFFRLQLAMKGADDAITASQFEVSVAPIVSDKGLILLNVQSEDNAVKNFTVFIDEKQREFDAKGFLVTEGNHTLSVVSDYYRNEVRTVTVERAKISKVDIMLRGINPNVRFIAPENTRVVFDDNDVTGKGSLFATTPGDHTVKFYIGDYEITKTLSLENGKNYNISVNIEAVVTEEND